MAKKRQTPEQKRISNLISRECQNACGGYQINIMDLHKLTDAGEAAANSGKSDAEIIAAIHAARDLVGKKVA